MSGGIDAGGQWAFKFERDKTFRCFALVSGRCWLTLDGAANPVALEAGDFVVLPHGEAFCLTSDLAVKPIDIMSVITEPLIGRILSWQGGGECLAISALFTFAGSQGSILLGALPAIIHIRNDSDRSAMRWYVERMMAVLREAQPGRILLGEYLAQMILIETLRLHVADSSAGGVGWLRALADPAIGAAITAIQQNPGYRWTLQELAQCAGMSRSAFALRFKETVGSSAIEYLTRWRMILAADRLLNSQESVLTVAQALGYESESAFGFAFKRQMGCAPRQYGRQQGGIGCAVS